MPRKSRSPVARSIFSISLGALLCSSETGGSEDHADRDHEGHVTAFNGASFGSVGQYEILDGIAFGEVDPKDSLTRYHGHQVARETGAAWSSTSR